MGYRPPQNQRGLKLLVILKLSDPVRYRPPQNQRGLKLFSVLYGLLLSDIDHPKIKGD